MRPFRPRRRHRIRTVVLTAALISLATPPPVALAAPSITLKKYCDAAGTGFSLGVTGAGWQGGAPIGIEFNNKYVGAGDANNSGTFSTTVDVPAQPRGEYTVKASDIVPGLGPPGGGGTPTLFPKPRRVTHQSAFAPFGVPCPTITIDPICGPADVVHNVRVDGSNFLTSLQTATVDFGVNNFPVAVKPDRTFSTTIPTPARPAGIYSVSARQSNGAGVSVAAPRVAYTVPCPSTTNPTPPDDKKPPPPPPPGVTYNPTMRFEPPVGQPGRITVAVGTGFPPGSVVTITFPGHPGSWTVSADGSGGFRRAIFVLPHEGLGPRTGVGQTGGAPPAQAPYLVVPAPVQPSGFPFSQLVARR